MKVSMRVSVSRSDGFCARQGEIVDIEDSIAQEMIEDGRAEIGDTGTLIGSAESGTIDLSDGADEDELSLANKTLARGRKWKGA